MGSRKVRNVNDFDANAEPKSSGIFWHRRGNEMVSESVPKGPSTLPQGRPPHIRSLLPLQALRYQRPRPFANQMLPVGHVPCVPPQRHMSLQPIDPEEPQPRSGLYQYLSDRANLLMVQWLCQCLESHALSGTMTSYDLILARKTRCWNQFKWRKLARKISRKETKRASLEDHEGDEVIAAMCESVQNLNLKVECLANLSEVQ